MGYDKDWEVHLALNDPNDPIHGYIEEQLKDKDKEDVSIPQYDNCPTCAGTGWRDCPRCKGTGKLRGGRSDSQEKHG